MVKAIELRKWCDVNISPMAWCLIAMKSLPDLVNEKVSLVNINEETLLSEEVFEIINYYMKDMYNKEFPINLN